VLLELAVLFGVMLAGMALGAPIFFAMAAAVAAYAAAFHPKLPVIAIAQTFAQGIDSDNYAAIAFFFLAGEVMNAGGISRRLLRLATALVGHVRGGLSHVNVLAGMVFAGVSGSAVADASAIGAVLVPAMKRAGYGAGYAAAVTAASATIGPVIPPSIPLVVYGLFAGVSIGELFLAGVVPGLLMGLFLLAASGLVSWRRRYPATAWPGRRELGRAALDAALALLMPVIVVVGLAGGVATVTEVGAVAAVYAILVSLVAYRDLTLPELWRACQRAALAAAMVLVIVSVAGAFVWIVANMGAARHLAAAVAGLSTDPTVVLAAIAVLLLLLGTVLEPVTLLIVVVPMLVPTARAVGVDLVQLGIVAVLATLIGLVTPPVGFLIYLTAAQAETPASTVVRELTPFLAALLILLGCLVLFPAWTLWLPRLLG
jgi:tripartite ATP-independent transporter DctM subunit